MLPPINNRGVVVQNEMMFHRGDSVGRPDERTIEGLKHRSLFGYRPDEDQWAITTDDEPVRRYGPEEIRLLVHWNAEVYADMDEVRKVMDHTDDINHQLVVDTFLADLRGRGIKVADPTDPLHDVDWIQALMGAYTIAPTTDWLDPAA